MELVKVPTLYVDFLEPEGLKLGTTGNAIDGGRNGLGESISMEMSGGGVVACTYSNCNIYLPEQNEYITYLSAELNGGYRAINVPFKTDGIGPFEVVDRYPQITALSQFYTDQTSFDDGGYFSQSTTYGVVTEDAAIGGAIKIQVFGASRDLRWSDWFSIDHPTKGSRAYRYRKVLSKSSDANPIYSLLLGHPLREAVSAGQRVELVRPRCVMKFRSGFNLDWEVTGFYRATPTLQFIEAF